MTIRDVFESARRVGRFDVCVDRPKLFSGVGRKEPYSKEEYLSKKELDLLGKRQLSGDGLKLVDVCSARQHSLFSYTRKQAKCDISLRVIIRDWMRGGVQASNAGAAKRVNRRFAYNKVDNSTSFVLQFVNNRGVTRYEVFVLAENHCEARFRLCKELSHIITNTVQDPGGGIKPVDELLSEAENWKNAIPGLDVPMADEHVGLYHAIEVMLPWKLRDGFVELCQEGSLEANNMKIAKRFMILRKVIDHVRQRGDFGREMFCKDTSYDAFSHQLNTDMDIAERNAAPE